MCFTTFPFASYVRLQAEAKRNKRGHCFSPPETFTGAPSNLLLLQVTFSFLVLDERTPMTLPTIERVYFNLVYRARWGE